MKNPFRKKTGFRGPSRMLESPKSSDKPMPVPKHWDAARRAFTNPDNKSNPQRGITPNDD